MTIGRFLRTVRHLRASQILNRALLPIPRPAPSGAPAPPPESWEALLPTAPPPARLGAAPEGRFTFQGLEGGRFQWHRRDRPLLWQFHLHYFEDLLRPDLPLGPSEIDAWMLDWVAENPVGTGVGWHPYPLSRRVANWVFRAGSGHSLPRPCLDSLAVQVRFLRRRLERHLGGNHLLANGKALVAAGLFFSGDEAASWYDQGVDILGREIQDQVLSDGGHFERSVSYHRSVLVDLMDLMNMHRAAGKPTPPTWLDTVRRMANWGARMTHGDGGAPLFNDANEDMAPGWREIRDYARRLSVESWPTPATAQHRVVVDDLAASGYVRILSEDFLLFLDLAPLGPDHLPAHGHADTLSFELAVGGHRVAVDSGVSTYETGDARQWERGTAAHNTVTVDGRDSSEVWGSFRVGRRARVIERRIQHADDEVVVQAAHDGFSFLGCRHRRGWTVRDGSLEVEDRVEGGRRRRLESHLHLHPDLKPIQASTSEVVLEGNGIKVRVVPADGVVMRLGQGYQAPRFGVRLENVHLTFESVDQETIGYAIRWDAPVHGSDIGI